VLQAHCYVTASGISFLFTLVYGSGMQLFKPSVIMNSNCRGKLNPTPIDKILSASIYYATHDSSRHSAGSKSGKKEVECALCDLMKTAMTNN
jgi:hypothetical protein